MKKIYMASLIHYAPGFVDHAPAIIEADNRDEAVGIALRLARERYTGNVDVAVTEIATDILRRMARNLPEGE